jgi:hypothetical protein
VRRGGIEIEVVFLHVLAMVAFGGDQPEEPLLQDGIALVPEGEGKAEDLVAVADASEAVFSPAVGLAPSPIMGEVAPGVPVGTVVLADGAPRPLREVGTPPPPAGMVVRDLAEPGVLGRVGGPRHEVLLPLEVGPRNL